MSKTEPVHLVRCLARAAHPELGPRRLRLSVTQHGGFPFFFAKKRVLADLVFAEHAWERHATGEWRNKTPCTLVRPRTLRKVKTAAAALPVQVKVCTMRGAVHTSQHLQLGDLLQRLQSCTAPLTLEVTCSSVGVELTWPAEGTAATQVSAHLASTTAADGIASGTAGDPPLQDETAPQGPLHVLECVASTTSFSGTDQPVFTGKAEATPPHCKNDEESEPSRPLRFPDSGSVFAQLLKEYETHNVEAAEDNTREEKKMKEAEEQRRPWRPLMYLNSAAAQFLPLCFIGFFFVNLHREFIPRVYGSWAFWVRAAMWVSASVTSVLFYAISWMPAGRVTRQHAAGKEGEPGWYVHCVKCDQPRPDIARHCPVCQQCVWERDHHCRYVGNCLGRDNVQAFMLMYAWMPTVTLVHLAILVGGAWWRQLPLTLFQCIQGASSLALHIFFVFFIDVVRGNRRRIKQRYPTFFSQDQHDWFD